MSVIRFFVALAVLLCAAAPIAQAQMGASFYVTPKILYSYQTMDTGSSLVGQGGGWQNLLGGQKSDSAWGAGLSVGYDMAYMYDLPFRLEAEYLFRTTASGGYSGSAGGFSGNRKIDIQAQTLFTNLYFDINTGTDFTPYLGGGLGLAYLRSKSTQSASAGGNSMSTSYKNTDWNLGWKIGGGLAYQFSDTIALDVGYSYLNFGSAGASGTTYQINPYTAAMGQSSELTAHELSLGLRFTGF